jgi:hypothetical protein
MMGLDGPAALDRALASGYSALSAKQEQDFQVARAGTE